MNAVALLSPSEVGISAVLASTRAGSSLPPGSNAAAFLPWMQLLFGGSAGDGSAPSQGATPPAGPYETGAAQRALDAAPQAESAAQHALAEIDVATMRRESLGVHPPSPQRPSQLAESLIRSMLADGIWSARASGARAREEADPNAGDLTGEAQEIPGRNSISAVPAKIFTSPRSLPIKNAEHSPALVRRSNDRISDAMNTPPSTGEASEADRMPDMPGEPKQNAVAQFPLAAFIGSPIVTNTFESPSAGFPGRHQNAWQPGDAAQSRSSSLILTGVLQTAPFVESAPWNPAPPTAPLSGSAGDKGFAFGATVTPRANNVPESPAAHSTTTADREHKTLETKEASRPSFSASMVHSPLKERPGGFNPGTDSEAACDNPFAGAGRQSTTELAGNEAGHGIGPAHVSPPVAAPSPLPSTALLTPQEPVLAGHAQPTHAPGLNSDASRMETPTPKQDLSLRVSHMETPVDLHVRQKAGAVHVAVRTPDEALQTVLRRELPDLVQSLDRAGYVAETFTDMQHRPSTGGEDASRQYFHNGNDPTPWESAHHDGQRREQERLMEQWIKQMTE